MSYINTNDSYGSFVKYSGSAGTYTYSYSTLSLNSSISDQDQLIVVRKFTPSSTFEAAAAPDGLGGTKIAASEQWDAWTLPNTSSSGSTMYTIDTVAKTITLSNTNADYVWNRSGTTVNLPVFVPSTDTIIIARKTYGVSPFVTWASGSKLTSAQLNHQTTQLIYLSQELLDKIHNASDLDPYYGTPSGYATLNTLGALSSANTNTLTSGDGLTGGGDIGDNLTLAVDLADDSGLEFDVNKLRVNTDTTIIRGTAGLGVILKTNGALLSDADGVYVDLEDSVTSTSTAKALTANQGKTLKGLIDALGTGVNYLGSVAAGVKAAATDALKITGGTVYHNDAFTVLVPEDAGGYAGDVTATVIARTSMGSTPSANQIHWYLDPSGDAAKIANLKLAINGTTDTAKVKFGSSFTNTLGVKGLTASDGVASTESYASLTADNAGADGNDIALTDTVSTVLVNESALTDGKLAGGITQSSFPTGSGGGGAFAGGDTVDIITRSGFVTPTGGTEMEVTVGEDIRYNGSAWYNAGATATLDDTAYFKHDGSRVATGEFNLGSNKITALATPTGGTDAATKTYVDSGWFSGAAASNHILKYSGSAWESGTIGMEHIGNENISATPALGDIIAWDNDTSKWTNSSIVSTPQIWYTGGAGEYAIDLAPDGTIVAFAVGDAVLPNSTVASAWFVTIDGIVQPANTYSISGDTLTFTTAPPDEAELYFVCFGVMVTTSIAASVGDLSATTVTTTGDITVGGDISIDGGDITSSGSTVNVVKDFAVNTNKFTVDEATGNTTIAGTLDVVGSTTHNGEAELRLLEIISRKTENNHDSANAMTTTWKSLGQVLEITPRKAGDIVMISANIPWYMQNTTTNSRYVQVRLIKNFTSSEVMPTTLDGGTDITDDNGDVGSNHYRYFWISAQTVLYMPIEFKYTITADDVSTYDGGIGTKVKIGLFGYASNTNVKYQGNYGSTLYGYYYST